MKQNGRVVMKTSCFKYYTGDKGIAICVYPPIGWTGPSFNKLAPERKLFFDVKAGRITREEYKMLYRAQLEKLDAQEIYNVLKGHVLLCWEKPVFGENKKIINEGAGFCHRHIVSQWIWETLKIEILEWTPEDENKTYLNKPLF